ncbi:hypothetical protein PENTCL1PPCAC_15808, partial [Pristionchus entomophagus]
SCFSFQSCTTTTIIIPSLEPPSSEAPLPEQPSLLTIIITIITRWRAQLSPEPQSPLPPMSPCTTRSPLSSTTRPTTTIIMVLERSLLAPLLEPRPLIITPLITTATTEQPSHAIENFPCVFLGIDECIKTSTRAI